MAMIIFFSIVLSVYVLVNLHIYRYTKVLFSFDDISGISLKIVFFIVVFAYPLGRFIERAFPSTLSEIVVKVGSFWLGAMVYLVLLFLLIDIIRLVLPLVGSTISLSPAKNPFLVRIIVLGVYSFTTVILIGGYINAISPRVNKISIVTNKELKNSHRLRIGVASDIHLGTIISNGRLVQFVNLMNSQQPDIILLAGDVFDEDLGPVIKNDMGQLLSQLKAPLGVFAVTGNHEYIGGVDPAVDYLKNHGIDVIRDTAKLIEESILLIGREDRQSKVMGGYSRKSLHDIVKGFDSSNFKILLDHQPYNLNEAVKNGIDLQISGHTHHGQLFPFNLITKAIFEVSKGLKQIENTHVYVSTGFGTWGPPVRIGNRPEIAIIEVVGRQPGS